MNRPAPRAALALSLTLLVPLLATASVGTARAVGVEPLSAPVAPAGPGGVRHAATRSVTPRSFRFIDLPRRAPGETIPVTLRREHEWEELAEQIEGLKAHPPDLPVTDLAQFTADATPAAAGVKGSLSPLAPTVGNGFEGITQAGFIPSEPTVGAGPLNIFSAGNVSVTVTNKDGTNRVETAGATFFGVPAAEGAISDAQCYYDALRGRFVAIAFTQGVGPNFSNFYLAISKTNDARGAWWLYKFDMTLDGSTPTANWGDYEGIGISDDKLVFSSQQFTFAADAYQYQKLRVIDRALAYSGGPVSYVDIVNFAAPAGDVNDNFVTKPARNLTAGDNTIHCLCVRTGGGTHVTYRTLTGTPAAPVLSAGNIVTVGSYSPPPDAPQQGSAALVATNDCRPTDFYTRSGVLIATWHSAATIGGTSVSAVRLFRMRTSDRAVLTDETFGQANTFYYFPAVTVDSLGTIFLGFDRSSTSEFPSAYATGKRRNDATLQASTLLKAGVAATAQTRWGDYTGIDQDASQLSPGQSVAWYAGQWSKGANTFGTWVNKLVFPFGQVFGTVSADCDGIAGTPDRTPLAGVSVALKQGVTTLANTTTDVNGQYSFGYLESGTYDVVATPPAGGTNVDAIPGTGGTTQTRVSASDVQIVMTSAQSSTANNFAVGIVKPLPVMTTIAPDTMTASGSPQTLTVNGSSFSTCSTVRVDGSDRATSFVNANQLTASITAADQAVAGSRTITVFTPTPGGGTSSGKTLTIKAPPDAIPPSVTVTSPVGGESWASASVHNITWTATDNQAVTAVDLALSTDGGATFPTAIATGLANSGTFAWTLPTMITSQARVRARAFDAVGNVGSDSSHTNFSITGFTVTASAGANGAIAPSGTTIVADGATPSYTITPNANYHVQDVLVNGSSVGAVTNFAFPPIHANQTISASFAINTYTLALLASGNGTVTAVPSQATYNHGTSVQITATPAAGWFFDFWSGDTTGTTNPLTFIMRNNKTITANFSQHIYTWNQSGFASWATAANWTPARTAPSATDVLVFNSGVVTTATGVVGQTIGQLLVSGNTNLTLQAAGAVTLNIAGGLGSDLSVAAGATLATTGTNAITVAIASGATGDVFGTTSLAGGAHRITAADAGSLVYESGSTFTAGTSFSGSPFGTTSLNSVVFQSGSLYQHIAGGNPFGATAPSSVVTFQAGSRYRLDGAITPSMSGRTYADFECNVASTLSPTGGTQVTLDSLVVTQGTLNVNLTGGAVIRGDVHVKAGATLGFNPASGSPSFSFAGSAPQSIDIQGTFTSNTNPTIRVNNAAGVSLLTNLTLNSPLSFTNGLLNTGARTLTLASTSNIFSAGQGSGWVNGNLKKNYATGAFSNVLDVGDAVTYAPIVISGSGAGAGFNLTASTTAGDHPNLATSTIDPLRSANRVWALAPASAAGATWSATFDFAASDLDAAADPLTFIGRVWNGSAWSGLTLGALTSSATQVTGLTASTPGTQFAFGNLQMFTITASAGAGGSISPNGSVTVPMNGNQTFNVSPNAGFGISDVQVDGSSVGAVTSYSFNTVTANHTIAASFTGVPRTLTVNVVGGGSVTKSPNQPTYPNGTTVQLTAVPNAGWSFSGWSGALTGSTNPANLLMDADKTVTATFVDVQGPVTTVTSPVGGESWPGGSVHDITWTATDNAAVTAVDLALSTDGGASFPTAIATGIANSGTFAWTLPGLVSTQARVRVRARDAAGNVGSDSSHTNFSITDAQGPTATVTSPVGGESWTGGSVHNITWTATDNAAVTAVDLALSTDGGASFPTAIATGIANSGTFAWTLPGLVSTQARVRVRARDAAGNVGSDSSHTNFSITGWTITASAGANGSIAPSGTIGVADGATPSFTISPNAGCQVQDVLVNGSSVGAVTNFAFPAVHANQTISATFVDAQAPAAAVTAPNGAEQTYVGGHMNVTWTATDNIAVTTVDLDLSRAGAGGPFESIAAGIANTGTFDWLVSGPATSTAFVRVTAHDAATNSAQDLSDAAFEIFATAGVLDGPITEFGLAPVWPNPVRGSTRFTIAMPRDARVRLSVHDVQGREQLVLADGVLSAGRHSIDWASGGGARLGPGLYFVRFAVPGHSYVRRFALVW